MGWDPSNSEWVPVACGCCDGIEWVSDEPAECQRCDGTGVLYKHIPSGVLAKQPGGISLGYY